MAEPENDSTTAKKKGGKKWIILIVLVFLLLGGAAAGGGFYYWKFVSAAADKNAKKGKSKKESTENQEEVKPEKTPEKPDEEVGSLKDALPDDGEVKHIIELQPFIINLTDTEQARYLRMSVTLGVGAEDEKSSEKPDQLFITRVRNAMLAVLSDKKSEEVLSVEGKAKLRRELLKAAQAASAEPEIYAIYITDFIVQL